MSDCVISIVGARPQFVKAAVVARAMKSAPEISHRIIHTGQHYDDAMSALFFREMQIPEPARNLEIGSGPQGRQTGRMLDAIEQVLIEEKPKWVLVYGDTNSTLAGAIAAQKLHIRTAHIEAGLRSFNREMPEELNRVLTDHASDMLFVPTEIAAQNLHREGISKSRIIYTGDVMHDAALFYGPLAAEKSRILSDLSLKKGGYILATTHRAENTDRPERLKAILSALSEVSKDRPVVLPIHPRTRGRIKEFNLQAGSVQVIDPVGYFDMLMLEGNAAVIVTDSGGVQKEAYFQRVPCVTIRTETEWRELVETGWNRLSNPEDSEGMAKAIQEAIGTRGAEQELYGGGAAGTRIVRALADKMAAAPVD